MPAAADLGRLAFTRAIARVRALPRSFRRSMSRWLCAKRVPRVSVDYSMEEPMQVMCTRTRVAFAFRLQKG